MFRKMRRPGRSFPSPAQRMSDFSGHADGVPLPVFYREGLFWAAYHILPKNYGKMCKILQKGLHFLYSRGILYGRYKKNSKLQLNRRKIYACNF